jgi:hypothetical protein
MGFISAIRDLLGIGKDRIETKKLLRELEELEKSASLIQRASFEDVKKYDPKFKELEDTIVELSAPDIKELPIRAKPNLSFIIIIIIIIILVIALFKLIGE